MMELYKKLRRNWSDLGWWKEEAVPFAYSRVSTALLNKYASAYYAVKGIEFVSIPDSDWDNLILFDACRYDHFEDLNKFDGNLEQRYSRAPQTPIFLQKNFGGRDFHDIVVVSANPHQSIQLENQQFHNVYHVWRTHWDDKLRTVHPESVTKVAKQAHNTHPEKRLIVHYMQPHAPFIGAVGRNQIGIQLGTQHAYNIAQGKTDASNDTDPYTMLKRGEIDQDTVIDAYNENLELVMAHAKNLVTNLVGKTVITADHGELFGEWAWPIPRKAYQHPPIMAQKLLEVPWLTIDSGRRKTITSDPPATQKSTSDRDVVQKRLEHLGYQ